MYGMWFPPEMLEAMQAAQAQAQGKPPEPADPPKKKNATPEEELAEAKANIDVAGQRMAGRIVGLLQREAGRLIDQYPILDNKMKSAQIERRLWFLFWKELDISHGKSPKCKKCGKKK